MLTFIKKYYSKFLFKLYLLSSGLHYDNIIRFREVLANLKIRGGEMVLDAGCGLGLYSMRIAYKGAHVIGGDLSLKFKHSLNLGNKEVLKLVNFILMDLNYIPLKSEVFDKIICIDVLEHIPTDNNVVAELSRVLKNNGEILVHVPNLKRYAKLRSKEKEKTLLLEKKTFGHVRCGYTLNQLINLFKKNDIQVYDYTYTFGLWSQIAGRFSSMFKDTIITFPLLLFLVLIEKSSKTNEYNGGILVIGRKVKSEGN